LAFKRPKKNGENNLGAAEFSEQVVSDKLDVLGH
jgi:hypothetical protein